MIKQRIEWIDIAKGILILLVIFGHLNAVKWFPKLDGIIKWIYTFHMMAFFIISGIVFNAKNDFKTFFLKKCKALLVPYAIFSVFGLLAVFKQFLNDKDIFDLLTNAGRMYLYGEGMWFLCALFIVEIIAYCLNNNNSIIKLLALIIAGGTTMNILEWNYRLSVMFQYMQLQDFI